MKKIISLICSMALLAGFVIPIQAAEETCPYCGRAKSQWVELTKGLDRFLAPAHYYLSGDVNRDKQLVFETEGVSCIDLAGHTLSSSARVFQVGEDETKPNSVMNIYDSVGGGILKGKGSTNNSWSGGSFYIEPGGTVNFYSGTLTTSNPATQTAGKGAVGAVCGTLNVYGGNVIGGTAYSYGGVFWIPSGGKVNLAGGTVTDGTAPVGAGIYSHYYGLVTLTGNARVGEIAFTGSSAEALAIKDNFSGTATLSLGSLASGTVIGISQNADLTGAALILKDSALTPLISGNNLIAGEGSWCDACKRNVTWTHITDKDVDSITVFSAGHYRLAENITASQQSLKNMSGTICLDLNGFSYTGGTRAFILENPSNATVNNMLNIMDSSEKQTGVLQAHGGSAYTGGVIYAYKNTTLNIYGGTVRSVADTGCAKLGATIATSGACTVNLYGGKVIGGNALDQGGAVYLRSSGVLNVAGGAIESGTSVNGGDCVYIADGGIVKLSGNGSVEQLYFAGSSASKLTVTGNYTGTAELKFKTMPSLGADIGNCENATLGKESITIGGTRYFATASGANLVAAKLNGAVADGVYCDTLAEALTKGSNIRLLADNAENITISKDVTLDLDGWNMTGAVTVTGTLYVKDTATDDYNVEDLAGYGKIAVISGNVQPASGYLALTENGQTSYHRYTLKLSKVNLRPGAAGIYYTADILIDQAVLAQTQRYGITVSVNTDTPTANDDKSIYTVGTNSVLISGILDGDATDAVDADTLIYGRPYILLTDGTCLYGNVYSTSLHTLTELVDDKLWDNLSLAQNRAYLQMQSTYQAVTSNWNLTNAQTSVQKAATAADDGVLKAIIIGNSDSTDATNLLYQIFMAEGWKKENLVLGCMYESGCGIVSHVKFAYNNQPEYKYYKNTGKNADGSWDCRENSTLEYALQDENWDIVILQESNSVSGIASNFENDDIERLITYVVNKLGYEPTLLWHFVGANPEIPEPYMSYVLSLDNADGDNSDASENEGWEDSGVDEPEDLVWIFDIARPSAPVAWAKRYMQYWNNDREVMYAAIAANVEKYIIGSDLYGFDGVIPSATTFQYAINSLGMTEQDMYRDYTHKSDYGRVMVSYMWYAILTGQTEMTQLQYTTVPANMRQKKFVQYGDLVLTDDQIQIILQSVNYALENPYKMP